jgi:type VI secretion system protein ImpK
MYKKTILLGCLGFCLTACVEEPPAPPPPPPKLQGQVQQFNLAGVQAIQQADRLTIIISTDNYFVAGTTRVKEEKEESLRNVAQFVKKFSGNYPHSVIKVTGFTDRVFSHKNQLQLSQSYAEAVAAYLFNTGVNPKRIAVQGRGANEPIAGEYEPTSAALNRRVVIQVN